MSDKFLIQKDIEYAGCALLTAINARTFITGECCLEPNTQEFEAFVDLVGCRYGSAISMYKGFYHLRLATQKGINDLEWIYHRIKEGRPVGLSIHTKDYGFHSVLVIGVAGSVLDIVNFKKGEVISQADWKDIRFPRTADWNRPIAFSLL